MPTRKLVALVKYDGKLYHILSPAVGVYFDAPTDGSVIIGGGSAGRIRVLNTIYDLYIPDDVFGAVIADANADKAIRVGYGQELFCLNPKSGLAELEEEHLAEKLGDYAADAEKGFIVTAFTDGIFYRKPSPDSPPYVEVGDRVEKGMTLGLIEVMKSFNHIVFQGTDRGDAGVVLKIYVDDASEVKCGQPLFLIGYDEPKPKEG